MVKKMKSTAAKSTPRSAKAAGLMDSQLAASVKDSAQQIWLAGMGAFSKAQEEGTKVFETLVKEGLSLQKKTQGLAEDKISEVTGKMTAMAGTVSAKKAANRAFFDFEAHVVDGRERPEPPGEPSDLYRDGHFIPSLVILVAS